MQELQRGWWDEWSTGVSPVNNNFHKNKCVSIDMFHVWNSEVKMETDTSAHSRNGYICPYSWDLNPSAYWVHTDHQARVSTPIRPQSILFHPYYYRLLPLTYTRGNFQQPIQLPIYKLIVYGMTGRTWKLCTDNSRGQDWTQPAVTCEAAVLLTVPPSN